MKARTVALICAVFVAGCSSEEQVAVVDTDTGKADVRRFWDALREGNAARVEGRAEAAIASYREALELDSTHEEALFYLGATLEQTGRYRDAVASYKKLLEVNPQSGRALSQLAELRSTPAPGAPHDFEAAETLIQRLLEVNREQAGPFLLLGRLSLNRGDWESAYDHFRVAAQAGAAEGHAFAGYTAYLQGDRQRAREHFERPIELQRREREMAGAGIRAEGDVLPAPDKPLSALDRAALIATFFLRSMEEQEGEGDKPFEHVRGKFAAAGRGAWGDYDGDGRPDLAVGGECLALYRNNGGSFTDVTRGAGLAGVADVGELAWVDYDGDGKRDLYASGADGVRLFRNLEEGGFRDVAAEAGLAGMRPLYRAMFFDADGDGKTDLLETGPAGEHPRVRLYRNQRGAFVRAKAPVVGPGAAVVDAAAADFDNNGRMDLALACWRGGARVFLNRGDGAWEEAEQGRVVRDCLSVLPFDYDRDGAVDLLVTAHASWEDSLRSLLQPAFQSDSSGPKLLRNEGGGRFADVTRDAGLDGRHGTVEALAADFDGDGWSDLALLNGSLDSCRLEPSRILRGGKGGFEPWLRLPSGGGPANLISGAVADFDRDGAPDLYLEANPRLPGGGGVFRNTVREARSRRGP